MDFPYGKAPLAIALLALVSGGVLLGLNISSRVQHRPDFILATFVKEHAEAYAKALPEFEKRHGVKVQIQVVDQRALQSRLQSALQAGADVPDMVELLYGTMGLFTRGPIEDVGFIDLTEKVHSSGLYEKLVTSRFAMWSSRGHIFALPHDVHPVMLVYRKDLVEQLGIDTGRLTTWDEFCRVGRQVTADLNGDGVPDRYMIDLQANGGDMLRLLMLQRGVDLFDDQGDVAYDNETAVDVICWYIRQIEGKERIAFPAGWGQTLSQAMLDGLCLFYICPDWRSNQIRLDIPALKGKLGLMPLPAWEPGGRRTSTWGGTGLAFTKKCRNFELAWELAMFLYYDPRQLGDRFLQTHILPPLIQAWDQPEFSMPNEFYGGIPLGRVYAELAPQVPAGQSNAYMTLAIGKLSEAYENSLLYFRKNGQQGLRDYVRAELKRTADITRRVMRRNVFLYPPTQPAGAGGNSQ